MDAVKLNKQDAGSIRAVELMDKLFSIDAQAREEKMDHAARHLLRQEKAPPVLNEIREHIVATRQAVLPGSKAGQACKYTLTLWEKLTRFLEYPELELSNNLAENSMRPVALGRSNWIHIGSSQAGPRIAAILSVVEAAAGSGFQCANTSPPSCLDSLIRPFSTSPNSRPLPGRQKPKLRKLPSSPSRHSQPCTWPDAYPGLAFEQ